jgi:hypothetical protein
MIWQFDPHEGMTQLPDYAPARSLHPTYYPTRAVWEMRLRAAGIDPGSADVIIAAIVSRGLRLAVGRRRRTGRWCWSRSTSRSGRGAAISRIRCRRSRR